MPIPGFTQQGVLPNDIYDCSLEEMESVFGRFQSTDCRINLAKKLKGYIDELKKSRFGIELIIDGSYVTKKDNPEDIDLILVLADDFDYSAEIKPFEYNLTSNKAVKRIYGFDVFTAKKGTDRYSHLVEFFQKVKEDPDISKGLLRIKL